MTTINASSGNSTLVSGAGNDTLNGNSLGDITYEISNTATSVTLAGTSATDTVLIDAGTYVTDLASSTSVVNGQTVLNLQSDNGGNLAIDSPNPATLVEFASGGEMTLADLQTITSINYGGLIVLGGNPGSVGMHQSNGYVIDDVPGDTITAYGNNDFLIGGNGAATLIGAGSNDTYVVNNSDIVIQAPAGYGSNTVQSLIDYTLGSNLNSLSGIGNADLTLIGNSLSNVITANNGNDTLVAGSGLATLIGGSGNDTFVINNVNDVINEAANDGDNTEKTSVSTTLAANVQNLMGIGSADLTLTGNNMTNVITSNNGNDTLIAGNGNTVFNASGTGLATMIGGWGHDTFVINNGLDTIVEAPGASGVEETSASATLAANISLFIGIGTGDVAMTGNNLPDTLSANIGNDTLIAGSGLATLVGGIGNDTFVINNVNDVIQASSGSNNTEQSSVTTILAANVQSLTGAGSADLSLTGNNLGNTITANGGNDTLVAGNGVATLVGGSGNDTFAINNVADVIIEAPNNGNNTELSSVSTTVNANVQNLSGTGSADLSLYGNNLNGVITGNSGNDTLTAGGGSETLVAGSGLATLIGGKGNDTFVINNASDVITEAANSGNNTEQTSVTVTLANNVQNLTGTGTASLTLTGNGLPNVITANNANDMLVAGVNDTLVAGSGNDTLEGPGGVALATMIGGAGNDTFVVTNSGDVIQASGAAAGSVVDTSVNYTLPAGLYNMVVSNNVSQTTVTGNSLNGQTITVSQGQANIISGTGVTTMVAGAGASAVNFTVNNPADVIIAAAGQLNTASSPYSYVLPANVSSLAGTGSTDIVLTGNSAANTTVYGNSGNDTLIAGTGSQDTLYAGTGNDLLVMNNSSDVIQLHVGTHGTDIEQVSFNATTYPAVQYLVGAGSANLSLTGNGQSGNVIVANSANDTLTAGSGTDVLEGGAGNDVIQDARAGALLAGSGNDTLSGSAGSQFIAGGSGHDAITLGSGVAVVAFNSGDGAATITAKTGTSNVLSLGGGIAYADLSFSKSGNNLILNTGGSNSITLNNWYGGSANQDFVTLQVIEQAAATYNPASSNTLYNSEVEEFSFTQLVSAFNSALSANPNLTSWSLSNALLTDHLSSSNTAALGGDLAYYEGMNGNLTNLNLATAVSTLQTSGFGSAAQTVDAWSGISNGLNKLK